MEKSQSYRYCLAKKFPKYLPFCETLDHLDDVKFNFTASETAAHFLNFWRSKLEKVKNNIAIKHSAPAFEEQYCLAQNRFFKAEKGVKLSIADFGGENLTFFEKTCPGFSNAIFLMETFYEDPTMFFENYEDLVDSSQKNDIFETIEDLAEIQPKNGYFESTRDFVESHQKNDIFENKGDFADSHPKNGSLAFSGDFADSHPKNGCLAFSGDLADSQLKSGSFVISGFFVFFTYKKSNFRVFTKRRFCNMQPPYFHIFARFDKILSRVGAARIKSFGGRGHRLSISQENKISRFKFIF